MKIIRNIVLLILIVVVALLLMKNILIKTAMTTVGSSVLGAKVEVESVNLSLLKQSVRIRGIEVYNPKGQGFPDESFIHIPEVGVDLDVGALMTGKVHLLKVILNMNEMVLVKNADGKMNVDSLKVTQQAEKEPQKQEETPQKESGELPPFLIEELHLNINQIVYKDYSKGAEPVIKGYDVGLKDKVFKNIDSVAQLASTVLVGAMSSTAIEGLKIYAASALLGPAGIVGAVMLGDSGSGQTLEAPVDKVYAAALAYMQEKGDVSSQDQASGVIKGKVNGADIIIELQADGSSTNVAVSARKMFLPQPKIAGGIVYEIKERVK